MVKIRQIDFLALTLKLWLLDFESSTTNKNGVLLADLKKLSDN